MSPATPSVSGTLVASFLFVDLVGYAELTTAEQYARRRALSAVLLRNLGVLRAADYRIRETGEGAWIAFLSNPEHALYMALAMAREAPPQGADEGLSIEMLRVGMNLGAVKEAIDLETRPHFIGDGINAAKRVMDSARPGEVRASRSFHDAVANLDSAYVALFTPVAGARGEGTMHDLYVIRPSEVVLARLEIDLSKSPPKPSMLAQATELVRKWFIPFNALIAFTGFAAAAFERVPRYAHATRIACIALAALAVVLVALDVIRTRGYGHRLWSRFPRVADVVANRPTSLVAVTTAVMFGIASLFVSSGKMDEQAASNAAPAPAARPAEPAVASPAVAAPATSGAATPVGVAVIATPQNSDDGLRATKEAPAIRPAAKTAAGLEAIEASARIANRPGPLPKPNARDAAVTSMPSPPACSRIMEKAALGEPLSADEKRELAASCR